MPILVTEAYRGEPPFGTPPERVRVALVAGSGSVATDDLYRLLHRRLLIYSSIVAGGFLVGLGVNVLMWQSGLGRGIHEEPADLFEWLVLVWRLILMATISSASAFVLWRLPPPSVRGLRMIELVLLGSLVVMTLMDSANPHAIGRLEEAVHQPMWIRQALVARYSLAGALFWFVILTSYGVLIPNTWRRSAAVCGVVGLSPLVLFAVFGLWVRPLDHGIIWIVLVDNAFYVGLAVAIVVFASSRIEILRRQAAEARKLGQYILKERLGAGGMGEVYRAEHALLRRPSAIKVIRPEQAGDPKNLRRFEREVQATATLTHPNTIQIFDYGHAEDGTFYYVMEYLPGLTLDELVTRHGPMPPARAIHFLRQICGALREAHGRGLIHRDIKPGNVMVCERGGEHDVAKLLDFGLVLPPAHDPDGDKLTQEGMITGTPAYLSPEQAGGQETPDARSDIYSVGALAYFLLTGQPPFAGRSAVKMLAAHLYEKPEPLSGRCPEAPADLEAIVQRCLAKDPQARFPDAESLDKALAACEMAGLWTESDAAQCRTGPAKNLPTDAGIDNRVG